MEPIVSTSFIPKRPVSTEPVAPRQRSGAVGLLSFITFIIVLGTALAFVGVYLYGKSLDSQKAQLQSQIAQAENGLGSSFISDMQRLSQRITGVKTLISNHVVVSPIFAALQATTLQSVQYKNFTYQFVADPTTSAKMVQVTITGVAKNYATLALQSDAYAQSSIIRNPVFSDLTVEDKTQNIDFKLIFSVAASDLSYTTFINNLTQQGAVPAADVTNGAVTPTTQ